MNPPCKDCKDRAIGCHCQCERYGAFRREKEAGYAQALANSAAAYSCKQSPGLQKWYKNQLKDKKRGR